MNKTFKLICSDIDGTLLNKERVLSPKTLQVLGNIGKTVPVILISSRMPKAMKHLQIDLGIEDQALIAFNGGLVLSYERGLPTQLLSIEVPITITDLILQFVQKTSIHASLYHQDEWYVPAMDYWAKREQHNTKVDPEVASLSEICEHWKTKNIGPHKIMCMGAAEEMQSLEDWLQARFGEQLNIYRSKPTYLEISSKKISKLSALAFLLARQYQIDLSEVIAFGDNYNDVELIAGVGHGVAVANAKDALLAVAQEVSPSNIEDGVALTLEKYF